MAQINNVEERLMKVLIIGDSSVGKTCLLNRYADDFYTDENVPTIGIDFRVKHTTIDDVAVKLQIWDTAGQERFRTITTAYFRGANGVVIVYDVANKESFTHLQYWIDRVEQYCDESVKKCIVLVGNKDDGAEHKAVSTNEVESFSREHNIQFFETSACSGKNVAEAFDHLAKLYLAVYPVEKKKQAINVGRQEHKEQHNKKCC